MLQYVTRDEIVALGRESLSESLAKVAKAETRSPTNTTFLSHSSKDDDAMPGVVRVLENHGATVYLDKKDPTLLNQVPKDIASTLRDRINSCRKFIVFASDNIRDSKWVPWELGLADGFKRPRNVCVFPAPSKAHDTAWTTQEYLGIYDRIIWGDLEGYSDRQWMVYNHVTGVGTRLREWLTR